MKWTALLNGAIENEYRNVDALMAMVGDADLGWKPATGTNWMTTGQLLMHLTNACGACCQGFVTGDWGIPEGAGPGERTEASAGESMLPPAEALPTVGAVAEAREQLAKDKQVALAMVAQAGEDALETTRLAAPWDPNRPCALGEHLLGMVMHMQSHKAQLFYYLKLMGRDVNTRHLWGM